MPDSTARPRWKPSPPTIAAALAGLATGIRSTAGLAAASLNGRSAVARVGAAAALTGELVVDKLPGTPSRLEPAGLSARLVLAAACAVVLARRAGSSRSGVLAACAAGVLSAAAASVAGARWRRVAGGAFGADLPAALIEDAVGLALAAGSVRRRG